MPTHRLSAVIRVAVMTAGVLVFANRAAADAILLHNVQVQVDATTMVATVTAGLEAVASDGGDVFLDQIAVGLSQDGVDLDLFSGPTFLDDLPFYGLFSLAHGVRLPDTTVLFNITGLVAGATYAGVFEFFQFDAEGFTEPLFASQQAFSFTTPSSAVPEPGTLLLVATGAVALVVRRRRKLGVGH